MMGKPDRRDRACIYGGGRKAGGKRNNPHTRACYFCLARERNMQIDWRAICGPVLATATALIVIVLDGTRLAVPDPAPLFVCIVALASCLSGVASGLVSAAIA